MYIKVIGTALTLALVAGSVAATRPARAASPKGGSPLTAADVKGVPVVDGYPAASKEAWQVESRAVRGPAKVSWPVAGTSIVDTSSSAGPVRVTTAAQAQERSLRVTVHDRESTESAGVKGVLLSLEPADGKSGASTVNVQVDYSGFAGAFGGDWGTRLRLVSRPACALTTPKQPQCQGVSPLRTVNNAVKQTVAADVVVSGAAPNVVAVESEPTGDNGDFTATSLSAAGAWQVSTQGGSFSWNHPLRLPPSLGGPSPTVSLSYSSGGVDGRTGTSNNQGGWIGDGWDSWPGFIERKYSSCADDNPTHKTGDQCWFSYNATLSLSGHAGELIQSGNYWRLKDDDGTRVERVAGDGGRANGDNDNEYWVVTTTDGTKFYFGYHRLPGWTSGKAVTDSTWTLPVYGNNSNEPCHAATFAASWCAQAWRWNLDYVVDPHGNTLAYFYGKETGAYGRDLNPNQRTEYVRGGWLDRAEYGMRSGSEYAQASPLRVVFGTAERCLGSGCWQGAPWTSNPNPAAWKDTPWDLYCAAEPCSTVISPTFWSARRLSTVTSQVRNGASSYSNVESWVLRHEFLNAGNNEGTPMWLRGITRTGHVTTAGGAAVSDPEVTFGPGSEPLANRVDATGDGRTSLNRWRIKQIRTETGTDVLVTYSAKDCTRAAPPVPHSNTKRCMPSFYAPGGTGEPTLDWFHKYVVDRVDVDDIVTDQEPQSTFYDYLDTPAWHYSDDEMTPDKFKTWGQWRGYGRVRVRAGDPTQGAQTAVEHRYLRGMDGDKLPNNAVRDVWVPDTWGGAIEDHEALAGFELQQIVLNGFSGGSAGAEISSTRSEPWISGPTATRTRNGVTTKAWMALPATSRNRTALASGGFRYAKTTTAFNADGLPVAVDNFGDEAVNGDETCVRTTYARNDTTWMIDKVAQTETLAGTCAAPGSVLERSRTFYDVYLNEASFGAPPTEGDPVRTEELDSWSGSTPVYVRTATNGFDDNGRLTSTVDARGFTTTTVYTTANGGLVTKVATTNELEHETSETREPAWGLATKTVDPNGLPTEYTYDGLGRVTGVWRPDRPRATFPTAPSSKFSYLVRNSGGPTATTTETLVPTGAAYRTSIQLFDGRLRLRQVQTQAPGGGRTLADTRYNSRGEVDWTSAAYYDSTNSPPSTTLGQPQGTIPAVTDKEYDGAGRPTAEILLALGSEKWRTTTVYGGDRVHVTPPAGGTASTKISDAGGRTVELRQYLTFADVGSADPSRYVRTLYAQDLLGRLTAVTDQLGNVWTYKYDLRGRQIETKDPDRGTSTSTYDAAGNAVTVSAPLGTGNATVAYQYDEIGRKTAIRDDSVTGAVRAQWVYDTLPNGKGKLTSATRFSGGNSYVSRIDEYDAFGRPKTTSVTLPGAESALCVAAAPNPCTFTTTTTYRPTSVVGTMTLPPVADLPSEKFTYGYTTDTGDPVSMFSPLQIYVDSIGYDKLGQVIGRTLGDSSVSQHISYTYSIDEPTRRLTGMGVLPSLQPETIRYEYEYDNAGNVTKISDAPAGQVADHQCFGYDHLRRLTQAWTPGNGVCGTASYASMGGPAPYWYKWSINPIGNRIDEVRKAASGDTTFTYAHPTSGSTSVRPHVTTSVTASGAQTWIRNYTYDNAGNTKTRPGPGGASQTLTYDREGRLTGVSGGTSYIYDADGNRLIRKDPGGSKTLYLPDGTEVRYDQPTNACKATRYVSHNGVTIAVRTGAGLSWLVTDHHGTAEATIGASSFTVAKRRMTPYGEQRGATNGPWPSTMDKGFVGGTVDPTGLTHLGAREYDPFLGGFASVDPLVDTNDPQTLQGFAYGNNSPATFSDPDGRCIRLDDIDAPCLGSPNWEQRQKKVEQREQERYRKERERQRQRNMECRKMGECGKTYADPVYKRPQPYNRHNTCGLSLEALACTFQFLGGGTAGVCLNGMIGFGMVMGISGEVCLQTDQNGIFGTASYSVPWDRNYSNYAVGSGLGVVVQGSDARTKNDLADQFSFLNGGIGYVQGGYAWGNSSVDGRPVHVGELGLSAPTISSPGSGAAGHSNTLVSGYWYNYCDPIPCDALNAR